MTNEELFTDLKQFITATVSQQTARLEQRINVIEITMATKDDIKEVEQRLTARIDGLDDKIDQVQDAIADTLVQVTEALDMTEQAHDHETRLRRLEHRAA